jgi:hypothetical protein
VSYGNAVPRVYDTPTGRKIYTWIRRTPPLHKVIGTDAADQEITVALDGGSGTKWKDAIGSLYECVKLKGLNSSGDVVRTLSLDPDVDPAFRERQEVYEAGTAARRDARDHGSTLIAIDVPKLVDAIAKSMQEVAKSSAQQQSEAFKSGFEAMTNVVELCIGMLQRVDQRLEQMEEQASSAPELVESPAQSDGRGELAGAALMQALGMTPGGAMPAQVNPQQALQLQQLLQQYLGGAPAAAPEPNGHAG